LYVNETLFIQKEKLEKELLLFIAFYRTMKLL